METRENLIKPVPPFDFGLTVGHKYSFSADREEAGDIAPDDAFSRLAEVGDRLLLATVRSIGTIEHPTLQVTITGERVRAEDVAAVSEETAWMLGADIDLQGFYSAMRADAVMASIARRLYGLHPTRAPSVFEALVQAITSQQIAGNVARIIRELLIETYGGSMSVDGRTYHSFPTPQAFLKVGTEGLRGAKLSARKAEYLVGVATQAVSGALSREALVDLSDEDLVERLGRLRGVGSWTIEWVRMNAIGRPDGFPSGDLALRRVVSQLYFDGRALSEAEVEEFSWRWSPYRSLVTIYLFAAMRYGLLSDR